MIEFALILPVLLLLVMFALDFGRIYLGWVNLQSMARVAANYAANNSSAWTLPDDAKKQSQRDRYAELIKRDARAINCDPQYDPATTRPPDPIFSAGTGLGDPVAVNINCSFGVITPVISNILGGDVLLSAAATFPVKEGAIAAVPGGGGGPVVLPPVAKFTASPTSGYAPLTVNLVNTSTNAPTSQTWNFGDGNISFAADPGSHSYTAAGTYTISLTVSNAAGSDSTSVTITVTDPPTTGPVPEFTTLGPRTGSPPLSVTFKDLSTGGPISWSWDFGDGFTSTVQNPAHTYANPGSYNVTLTVSDGTTSNSQTKNAYIVVGDSPCIVPNLIGHPRKDVQKIWADAGFTTKVAYQVNGNYTVNYQSLQGGLVNPPGFCAATITVGP